MSRSGPSGARTAAERALPGRAGAFVRELGDRARLCDLYGDLGAPIYHDVSAGDTFEIRELVRLVRRRPGPVLDLAAGSGRLTLPLLALSRPVTALDNSPGLLDLLRTRLSCDFPRLRDLCTTVEADMRDFSLDRRFGAIVLGTTSVSLLDDSGRKGLYRSVVEHLAPGGCFLVSAADSDGEETAGTDVESTIVGVGGRTYRWFEYRPAGGDVRVVTIAAEPAADGSVTVCTSSVGVISAERLEAELASAGLVVRERHRPPKPSVRYRHTLLEAEAA